MARLNFCLGRKKEIWVNISIRQRSDFILSRAKLELKLEDAVEDTSKGLLFPPSLDACFTMEIKWHFSCRRNLWLLNFYTQISPSFSVPGAASLVKKLNIVSTRKDKSWIAWWFKTIMKAAGFSSLQFTEILYPTAWSIFPGYMDLVEGAPTHGTEGGTWQFLMSFPTQTNPGLFEFWGSVPQFRCQVSKPPVLTLPVRWAVTTFLNTAKQDPLTWTVRRRTHNKYPFA